MKLQSTLFALSLLAMSSEAFVPKSFPKVESSALFMSAEGEDRRSFVTKVRKKTLSCFKPFWYSCGWFLES